MNPDFQTISEQIRNILQREFQPSELQVTDDSEKHIGHAGHNGKGESHFKLFIVSDQFSGKSRIETHRMVYSALRDLIPPIHALQIDAKAG